MRQVLTDLPNVVGQTIDEATRTLEARGLHGDRGRPRRLRRGRRHRRGAEPRRGQGRRRNDGHHQPQQRQRRHRPPDVAGRTVSEAIGYLRSVGFGNVQPGACVEEKGIKGNGQATGTNPPGGTPVNRNSTILVDYKSEHCSQ